jgi:UDP-2,3-diacylglucosamine pyrophosphatase LpxH
MAVRNKRIFISDIHLGDSRSMNDPNHFGWFKKNVPLLAKFLEEISNAPDVKEVVILGDLFDDWVIPTNLEPLTSFEQICLNLDNKPVIDNLKGLAANQDIKLAYVPGNHDMSISGPGIAETKQFLEKTFPGIRYFCSNTAPLGSYNVGTLAAEHGDRYCLFNSPDLWAKPDTFLPLGYFISRIVAYKVVQNGKGQDPRQILIKFLKHYMKHPDFIEDLVIAIAQDAGLSAQDTIKLDGIPGYPGLMTVEEIGKLFKNLPKNWEETPGQINLGTAIMGDLENLYIAAQTTYFSTLHPTIDIVIFGHTHIPLLKKDKINPSDENPAAPCRRIYANSGTWVDQGRNCTYVETEEKPESRQHYVRIKSYQKGKTTTIDEGYVLM